MTDKERILIILAHLKSEGDKKTGGVDLKEFFHESDVLDISDCERIRDKLVINEYASFPTQGDHWRLSITWHPNGGVDILNKPKWAIGSNGKIKNIYSGWKLFAKHSLAITLSVIGGLVLFFLTDIVIKPRLQDNNKKSLSKPESVSNTLKNVDSITISQDSIKSEEYLKE